MAYTATKNAQGNYEVSLNGQKVTTGTSDVLGYYGLSQDNLGNSTAQTYQQPITPNIPSSANYDPSGAKTVPSAPVAPTQPTYQQPAPVTQTPQQSPQQIQQQSQQTTGQTNAAQPPSAPSAYLQPGAQGQDVAQLQNYLVQMGYLTPEQVSTGQGTYGPQTTAAVAKLQQDLGLNVGSQAGYYGPKTQEALGAKYNTFFNSVQNSAVPQSGADARAQIQNGITPDEPTSDPVFGAMASSMAPILQSLGQVLQNINNPALTATSLQSEYNQLSQQYNLPGMQADMLNMQNIMNGTENDIRDELSSAGGGGTESQVLAMSAARNKVVLKQYNSLSTQYQAAATNVQNMMQYAGQDQATQLQRTQMTASVTESMASIESQMMQMGMTMQNNARQAVQYNVTQMGYQGLAASTQGNPQMSKYYENMLGLAPGSLSNPATVAQMDTYKDQTLQLNSYKAAIAAFQSGYGGAPAGSQGSPTIPSGGVGSIPADSSTLTRPSWLNNDVPLSMSAGQMDQYMSAQKSASVDPGTNNVVAPGIGYYVHQSDGSYVLKTALPSPIEQQYQGIKQTIANAGVFNGSPTVTRKWTLSANSAISSFKDTGTYKVASNVAPYLAAIHAAAQNPGDKSISDFELLDSFVKAAKGGTGQVTDSQVNVMLNGASFKDKYNILEQKLSNGGVLAPDQRQALIHLADETYTRNLQDYQVGYVQAVQGMQGQGIPPQFWTNLPDFTSLMPTQ